jgi:hypothetical protein
VGLGFVPFELMKFFFEVAAFAAEFGVFHHDGHRIQRKQAGINRKRKGGKWTWRRDWLRVRARWRP